MPIKGNYFKISYVQQGHNLINNYILQDNTIQVIFSHFSVLSSAAEDFEMLCPSRLDELLKEAYALENSLIEQKEKLKHRLQLLSKTLGPLRSQIT